jgi:hypothetical protein
VRSKPSFSSAEFPDPPPPQKMPFNPIDQIRKVFKLFRIGDSFFLAVSPTYLPPIHLSLRVSVESEAYYFPPPPLGE